MRNVAFAVVSVLVAIGPAAGCTVLNDLDSYAGGTSRDVGSEEDATEPRDSTLPDSAVPDSSVPDSSAGDSGAMNDSVPADTSRDSIADTSIGDVGDADVTAIIDSAVDVVDTSAPDAADTGSCGALFASFGFSEFMVRAVFGAGDRHEWVEVTNYGSAPLNVSGVVVQVRSATGAEKATFTIPAGTTVASGEAVVFAGDKATFVAAVASTYTLGKVFDFAKTGDVLGNSGFEVRLIAPGCTTPYETIDGPARTWPLGQTYAYPPASTACPASGRITSTNGFSPPWKDVANEAANEYGSTPGDAGPQRLYGSPTRANVGVACP